ERRREKYRLLSEEQKEVIRKKVRDYHHAHRDCLNAQARQKRIEDPKRFKKYERGRGIKRKLWKDQNKEKLKALGKLYRDTIKHEAIKHYSPELCCIRCGISDMDVLTIDHIKGKGHQHRKMLGGGGLRFYYWLRKNNYPEGYQVLCLNCNWKKHLQEIRNANN
ncbi:hypothetical protein MUP59_07660, partial [Candidatus Bathyarchaeota archaeon]|nr:hypothetical protein [Candidatus Bathyarchaeota archaeon]